MDRESEDFVKESPEADLEQIEVSLLTEAIYRRWGYDFRDYAPASLKRRILRIVELEGVASISALQERLLRDAPCMQRFIDQILVSVTSMFRDPGFYRAFRAEAIRLLKQHSSLRIWHAGCASGEEVYSMAIVLQQEGLLEHSRIYATDLDQIALNTAKNGIYPLSKMKEFTENYQASGGETAFSEYYQAGHGHAAMRADLSKNIVWAQHNLVTDASFNEFHLIVCRNVLIYFNTELQARVHRLLYESLADDGVLVLGRQETLQMTPHESCFRAIDSREKIFQRVT
ncbi:chemotaxis protein methyltransferase [mine drainage metagenome]|uniref:Chemotaxis protein methyltransferase n=1 Tax=mine drainage metagenome TaxID=410659 RepID=A0A1J5PBU6_9ZZZZ